MTHECDVRHAYTIGCIYSTLEVIKYDLVMGNDKEALKKTDELIKHLKVDVIPEINRIGERSRMSEVEVNPASGHPGLICTHEDVTVD